MYYLSMFTERQQELIDYSGYITEVISNFALLYPDIFTASNYLAECESGPQLDMELVQLRTITSDLSNAATILSRTVEVTVDIYAETGLDARNHPLPMRSLLQDMAENCALVAFSVDQEDLTDLPLMTPEQLQQKLDKPQLAAWMQSNPASPEPEPVQSPAPDPSYAPVEVQPLAESPYPMAEPAPVQPVYPTAEPAPVQPAPQAQPAPEAQPSAPLPGDRSR